MIQVRSVVQAAVAIGWLVGCATPTERLPPSQGALPNHGYALLFSLLGDVRNVSKLLVIKRERPELRELIQGIAAIARRGHEQLEMFARSEPRLDLKGTGLPAAEVAAREAIARGRARELLTEGGKEFELQLLLSQNEALTYAAHLAETLAKTEKDPARSQYLRRLAGELHAAQKKVSAMLLANYQWRNR